jgi:hypothetical protein
MATGKSARGTNKKQVVETTCESHEKTSKDNQISSGEAAL